MIVDCHTHINFAEDDSVCSEHLESIKNVDICMVLAGLDSAAKDTNKKVAEYVGTHSEKMVGFGLLDPTKDPVSTRSLTSSIVKQGLKGVVLYCSDCGFHPAHSRAMRFYESAEELGLPVFFHNTHHRSSTGILEYAQPFLIDEVARTFGGLKIIIGAMGEPFLSQTIALVARHSNVYADLTINPAAIWHVYNTVITAYEHGVMDKLFFGSGFPIASSGPCIETLLGFNKLLGDTTLPTVPRGDIRTIIERDTLAILGIKD